MRIYDKQKIDAVNKIAENIVTNRDLYGGYKIYIFGKSGPTGKTYMCDTLQKEGFDAIDMSETMLSFGVEYADDKNHVSCIAHVNSIFIVLNERLDVEKENEDD